MASVASGSKDKKHRRGQRLELFTTGQAARVLGISTARVRRLIGLCRLRVQRQGRRYLLAFRDIALLRQVIRLSTLGGTFRQLRTAVEASENQASSERGFRALVFHSDEWGLVVEEGARYRDLGSGQLILPFPDLADQRRQPAKVRELRERFQTSALELQLDEDPAERWYALAVAREESGDLEGARQAYLAALRFDPGLSDACVNLGRLAHYEGHVERAANWYRRAIEIAPDDPIAHYNLAIALEDLGNLSEAMAEYQRALAYDWEFPEAHFNLSRLLRALGQQLAAMRHLRMYRQLTGSRR